MPHPEVIVTRSEDRRQGGLLFQPDHMEWLDTSPWLNMVKACVRRSKYRHLADKLCLVINWDGCVFTLGLRTSPYAFLPLEHMEWHPDRKPPGGGIHPIPRVDYIISLLEPKQVTAKRIEQHMRNVEVAKMEQKRHDMEAKIDFHRHLKRKGDLAGAVAIESMPYSATTSASRERLLEKLATLGKRD